MTIISTLKLLAPEPDHTFYKAFGLDDRVAVRAGDDPTSGFRGFSVSLIAAQPANVDALIEAALAAGATTLKPVKKSLWGYGGVVQAPDGSIWKVATSSKKNTGPAALEFDDVVLLLGCGDFAASKQFYVEHGFEVARSFGKYADFKAPTGVKLALYSRKAAAKDAGVPAEGTGSARLVIAADAGSFTDPDGFTWE